MATEAVYVKDGTGHRMRGPLPKMNITLLEQVIDIAKETVEGKATYRKWNQGLWAKRVMKKVLPRNEKGQLQGAAQEVCESYGCICGNALALTGHVSYHSHRDRCEDPTCCPAGMEEEAFVTPEISSYNNGIVKVDTSDWHKAGQEVLGLTGKEAETLFNGTNDLDDVIRIAKACAKARGEYLDV